MELDSWIYLMIALMMSMRIVAPTITGQLVYRVSCAYGERSYFFPS